MRALKTCCKMSDGYEVVVVVGGDGMGPDKNLDSYP